MSKKFILLGIVALGLFAAFKLTPLVGGLTPSNKASAQTLSPNVVSVYKTESCGCCSKWVDHLQEKGFEVKVETRQSLGAVRAKYGVPDQLASCHTAHVDGYTIEGHVPAKDIRRLLTERPVATGLSVPGMTVGSPGMEMDGRSDPYEVILFGPETGSIFASYP